MATESRLNTFCRFETLYGHSSRHFKIIEKVLMPLRDILRIYDVINVGFLRNFEVFVYDSV